MGSKIEHSQGVENKYVSIWLITITEKLLTLFLHPHLRSLKKVVKRNEQVRRLF